MFSRLTFTFVSPLIARVFAQPVPDHNAGLVRAP
jgi:hypothetical protein